MKFKRIKDKNAPILKEWMDLYETTFPPSERTDEEQFRRMIEHPQMQFHAVYHEEEPAGFYCLWNLDECYYLLYLATFPQLRNQGIGQKILGHIKETIDKPLFLEAENPVDELTSRRVNYYRRNGFMVLADNPGLLYDARYGSCRLLLMGNRKVENLTPYLEKIRDVVYGAMGNDDF